jgi:transcriptional regulator with XRE-family HTH domain
MQARQILAKNVRRLRKARKWTQEELAHRCKLHKNHVGMLERSEIAVTVDTLDSLATAFNLTPAKLLAR